MIRVVNLSKSFETESGIRPAVKDISLQVPPSTILAFLGPNGAGKSTTLKIMTGFLDADFGDVSFDGMSIKAHRVKCQKNLGYVPENAPLYTEMRAQDFLEFCAEVREIDHQVIPQKIQKVAKLCRIENVLGEKIENLSKGYRRRVAIAQALLHDPQYLILDEPTDGLDPNQKSDIRKVLRSLSQEGKTIIVSTHILEEVEAVADRVVLISEGGIRFHGSKEEFLQLSPESTIQQIFHNLTKDATEVAHV